MTNIPSIWKQSRYGIGLAAGLVCLFAIGVGTRGAVLQANVRALGGELPFTLESALQFHATERVYEGDSLAGVDPMIEYPDGIDLHRTDTVMAEYVYAALAHRLPDAVPLTDRVRWITVAWFSLSIPWMAIWVTGWTRSRSAGAVAALFYAVSLSSVIRSSGIELSRENFAMPFLVAHLALFEWAGRPSLRLRNRLALAVASAVTLGLALAAWDMIQFYVWMWTLIWVARTVFGPSMNRDEWWRWGLVAGGLWLAGWCSPYHRAHGFWASPPMWLIYGVCLQGLVFRRRSGRWPFRAAMTVLPLALFLVLPHGYTESYGHFAELLSAKIRYLTIKPADPSLLTFNQRIMWVPALDSATWSLTTMLFPSMLWIVSVSALTALFSGVSLSSASPPAGKAGLFQYIFFLGSSFIAYVFFVRFHVYLSLFSAAWVGWWWAWARHRRGWAPCVIWPLIFAGWIAEATQVLADPGRWGRPNVYYREVQELTEWLKEYAAPDPVLANFGVSAAIRAYGDCPIILHPKFERPGIRERVQTYGTTLFKEDEEAFRDWADAHGATMFVYALGEFATVHPELQMRYFVDALEPPEHAAARGFEFAPHRMTYFEYVWGNRKYRVFRVISREDERQADQLTILAERALERADLEQAETYAWSALALFPAQYRAREVVRHVGSLREQGFVYDAGEE